MSRRFLTRPLPPPGRQRLPASVAHHLGVVRARPGDVIRLCDGAGHEVEATLLELRRQTAQAEVGAPQEVRRAPARHVELAVALPRGTRAEWLFEHATEIGVAAFRPLRCARSRASGRGARSDRWRRIVDAAVEQCDRSHAPRIDDEVPLDSLLDAGDLPAVRLAAVPGAAAVQATPHATDPALWLVGPEGGLTAAEVAALDAAGFRRCGLGPLTLRVETAALIGAARLLG